MRNHLNPHQHVIKQTMPKFAVLLHGTGCRIEVDDAQSPPGNPRIEAVGFYTTRFIKAPSAEEAINRVMKLVQDELRNWNRAVELPKISVENLVEDQVGYDSYAPGGGFTWYPENSSPSEGEKIDVEH